tara:strand:- start:430 stop:825 length:396 start_codon:yes stop_codon:yes gene_type:complete
MKNFKNNRRRFRSNSFERNFRINSNGNNINSGFGNVSDFRKKNYSRNNFNTSKLIQKYSNLAREALSSGDKILYESYLQHVEHFTRVSDNLSTKHNSKVVNTEEATNDGDHNQQDDDKLNQDDQLQVEKNQ